MKFLVDLPLGGLAKWLRLCGFDAAGLRLSPTLPRTLPAPAPETYILTRQEAYRGLGRPDLLWLTADLPEAQLAEVCRLLKINPRHLKLLSRCSRCNEPLDPVDRDMVLGLVPEHVFHHHDRFFQCPRCGQVFWPGSHLKGMEKILAKIGGSS
jgi:uncharacterized protein